MKFLLLLFLFVGPIWAMCAMAAHSILSVTGRLTVKERLLTALFAPLVLGGLIVLMACEESKE